MKKEIFKYYVILFCFFCFFLFFHGENRLLSYCVIYHYDGKNSRQICYYHAHIGSKIDSFEDFSMNGYLYSGVEGIPFTLIENGKYIHVYFIQS